MGALDLNSIAEEFAQANEADSFFQTFLIKLFSDHIKIYLHAYNEFYKKYNN